MRWRRSPTALWRAAPGYLVLSTVEGRVIEVDGPGCELWTLLSDWTSEHDVISALAQRYGADERIVSGDVRPLLEKLHAHGYVDRET